MELGDHLAGLRIERGKQGRRAVPFVVVRPALDLARLHREQRLRAIERLNLRFLVDAEHRRVRGRIQIERHDVSHLVDEERIGRQLERFGAVWLQPEGLPDATDRRVTEADRLRHLPRTPVRGATRRGFQRANDHLLHLVVGNGALSARSRLIVEAVQALRDEPSAPFADRAGRHVQSPRDHLAVGPVGTRHDDPRSSRELWRRSRAMGQRVQSSSLFVGQDQRHLGTSRSHACLLVKEYERAAPFVSLSTITGH